MRARCWRRARSVPRRGPAPTRCSGARSSCARRRRPGVWSLAVRCDDSAASPFSVAVVAAPAHVLTVTVAACGGPVADAIVRAGPVRATTHAAGSARLHLAKGRHELAVWKAGYDAPPTPVEVEADAAVAIEAAVVPEDDPDAVWTA